MGGSLLRPRLCLIGNPDSIHVRRWAEHFASRDFEVHIVSFYPPDHDVPPGVTPHHLRARGAGRSAAGAGALSTISRYPGLLRLATAARFVRAGLRSAIQDLKPDIVHAHYVSDYGFLGAIAATDPLVVSAWGSDLLVDPLRSAITRRLVRWVLRRSALVTWDARQVADEAIRLGANPERMLEVVMGVEDEYLDRAENAPRPDARAPLIVSLRSLERPQYNVELIVRAMPAVLHVEPGARLVIGHDGALRSHLAKVAADLGVADAVEFVGLVSRPAGMLELLQRCAVYVSVPESDGTSVTLLEAMAAGAFPVVSDLPSNREWVDSTGGELVSGHSADELAAAIVRGLGDPERRVRAASRNLALVRARGAWGMNMARVEEAYRKLLRH